MIKGLDKKDLVNTWCKASELHWDILKHNFEHNMILHDKVEGIYVCPDRGLTQICKGSPVWREKKEVYLTEGGVWEYVTIPYVEPKLYQSLLTKDGRKTGNAVVVEVSEKYTLCKIRTDCGNTVKFNFKKFDIEEQFYLGKINENHKEIAVYNSLLKHGLEITLDENYDKRIELVKNQESIADIFSLSYYKELLRHNVINENERGE